MEKARVRIRRRAAASAVAVSLVGIPALVAAHALQAGASTAGSWTVYVGASGSMNFTPIDNAGTTSPSLGSPITIGQSARYAELSPDGSTLYADAGTSRLQVFSTATGSLVKDLSGNGLATPMGLALTPDGSELWVGNDATNNVMVFCVAAAGCGGSAQYTLMKTVAVGNTPLDVSITPDGSAAYVINFGGTQGQVQVVSTSTFAIQTTLSVPTAAHYTTFTPDGKFALVASCGNQACNSPGTVSVIQNPESATPTVVDQLATGQNGTHSVEVLPNCTSTSCTAYVDNYGSGTISVLSNAESASPTISMTISGVSGLTNPRFLVATPDSKFVYTGDATSNDVWQISTATNTVVNTLTSPNMHLRSAGIAPRAAGATGIQGFTVTPDQAPVATFTVSPGGAGRSSSFDASASTVTYGSIASYTWDFGDGSATSTTATPTTTHTYAVAGTYTATVTETSSGGASTTGVSTGHQDIAVGASTAKSSQSVTVGSGGSSSTAPTTAPSSTELYISQEHLQCTPQVASIVDWNGGQMSDIESGSPLVQPRGLDFSPHDVSTGNLMIPDASDGQGLFTMVGSAGTPTKVAYGPPYSPRDVFTDPSGNSIVADWPTLNKVPVESQFGFKPAGGVTNPVVSGATPAAILKITPSGQVSTVFSGSPLIAPHGITMDGQGNYIVADVGAGLIRITPSGVPTVVAGAGTNRIISTQDVAIDADGNYIAADGNGGNLWKVTPSGTVTAIHKGAPFTNLAFGSGNSNVGPRGVVVLNDGTYDVIDEGAKALFNVTASGTVTTLSQGGLLCDPADLLVVHDGTSTTTTSPTTPTTTPGGPGYWMLDSGGNVYSFGSAQKFGSATAIGTAAGIAPTPGGGGYWVVSTTGTVQSFGNAGHFSLSALPTSTVVTIASTADGGGYWIATAGGQVITAGDASDFGSPAGSGLHLAGSVVNMAPTSDGKGYWLLGSDGGVFSYGDASFHGSSGQINPAQQPGGANSFVPNRPIVAMVATSTGGGYWMVGTDGGTFAFGDAGFFGSSGQIDPSKPAGGSNSFVPAKPINGMVATSDGKGYWMVAADGGVFAFGDAGFVGSLGANPPASAVVGFAPV